MFAERELYNDDDEGDDEGATLKYDDFFKVFSSKKNQSKSASKRTKKVDEEDGGGDGDGEGFSKDEESQREFEDESVDDKSISGDDEEQEDEGDGDSNGLPLSSHQRRQAAMASQIRELEAELMGPRSWDLRGEVKGAERPENSLLGVTAEIERWVGVEGHISSDFFFLFF